MNTTSTRAGNRGRGFTLIELLVVVALVGIVLALALPAFQGIGGSSSVRAAVMEMRSTVYLARQRAITKNSTTHVLFPTRNKLTATANAVLGGSPSADCVPYQSYQLMIAGGVTLAAYRFEGNLRRLPPGLVFDPYIDAGATGSNAFSPANRLRRRIDCGGVDGPVNAPVWWQECPEVVDGQPCIVFFQGTGEMVYDPDYGGYWNTYRRKHYGTTIYIAKGIVDTNTQPAVCSVGASNGVAVAAHHLVGMPRVSDYRY